MNKNLENRMKELEEKVNNIDMFFSMLKFDKFNKEELISLHKRFFNLLNSSDNGTIRKSLIEEKKSYKIVNTLKEIVRKSSYSQQQIADMVEIKYNTLSNILNNRYNPSLEVALKLSYVFNKSVNDLFKLETID